jgi:hypothetical protein
VPLPCGKDRHRTLVIDDGCPLREHARIALCLREVITVLMGSAGLKHHPAPSRQPNDREALSPAHRAPSRTRAPNNRTHHVHSEWRSAPRGARVIAGGCGCCSPIRGCKKHLASTGKLSAGIWLGTRHPENVGPKAGCVSLNDETPGRPRRYLGWEDRVGVCAASDHHRLVPVRPRLHCHQ